MFTGLVFVTALYIFCEYVYIIYSVKAKFSNCSRGCQTMRLKLKIIILSLFDITMKYIWYRIFSSECISQDTLTIAYMWRWCKTETYNLRLNISNVSGIRTTKTSQIQVCAFTEGFRQVKKIQKSAKNSEVGGCVKHFVFMCFLCVVFMFPIVSKKIKIG